MEVEYNYQFFTRFKSSISIRAGFLFSSLQCDMREFSIRTRHVKSSREMKNRASWYYYRVGIFMLLNLCCFFIEEKIENNLSTLLSFSISIYLPWNDLSFLHNDSTEIAASVIPLSFAKSFFHLFSLIFSHTLLDEKKVFSHSPWHFSTIFHSRTWIWRMLCSPFFLPFAYHLQTTFKCYFLTSVTQLEFCDKLKIRENSKERKFLYKHKTTLFSSLEYQIFFIH